MHAQTAISNTWLPLMLTILVKVMTDEVNREKSEVAGGDYKY